MKRQVDKTGGKLWFNENLIDGFQDQLYKAIESHYKPYGSCIISGCEVSGSNIAEGIVYLDGKIMPFAGASGVTFPKYLKSRMTPVTAAYDDGHSDTTEEIYEAILSSTIPSGEYITISAQGGKNFRQAFQDANNRMVSDAKINEWNASRGNAVNDVRGGVADAFDTLEKLYDRVVKTTTASAVNQTKDVIQNLPPCKLAMGVGTPDAENYWYIVSLAYSVDTYKQIAYEYKGNRTAVRYINAFQDGYVSPWVFIATSNEVQSAKEAAIAAASSDATSKMNTREPKFSKNSGFNKDKSDAIDLGNSEKLATSKAVNDARANAISTASSDATSKMNTREPKFSKNSGFNKDKSDAIDLDDSEKLATSKAVKIAYDRAVKSTETGGAQNQTEDVIQNLPPCKLAMGVGTPVADKYWYIVSLQYSVNTYKQIAYEYNGNRIAVRYINAYNNGSVSPWEFIALENRNATFKELTVNDVIIK